MFIIALRQFVSWWRAPIVRTTVTLSLLFGVTTIGMATKPIHAYVALIVRSESDGVPIPKAQVTLSYLDPSETAKEKVSVAGSSAQTDKDGFAVPRAYAGTVDGNLSRLEVSAFRAHVEATGFKTFDGPVRIFYTAFRARGRVWMFIDEVHLALSSASNESGTHAQAFRPVAVIEPFWGDYKTEFQLTVKVVTPVVVAHEFPKDVMRVAYMGKSNDIKNPEVELRDDGKRPDRIAADFEFTGTIKPPAVSGEQAIGSIFLRLIPREDFHSYHSDEGTVHGWVESKAGLVLGGYFRRWVTVRAVVLEVPVRWAVADSASRAQDLFFEKFGPPERGP